MVAAAHSYTPEKGDVIWLEFDPQAGHEQAGRRPAVVLSVGSYNRAAGLALACPITNRAKGYAYEVPLPSEAPVTGVILSDQVKSVDWRARRATFIGTVSQDVLDRILDRIAAML